MLPFSMMFWSGSGKIGAISAERYNSIIHSVKRKILLLPLSTMFWSGSVNEVSVTTIWVLAPKGDGRDPNILITRYYSIIHTVKTIFYSPLILSKFLRALLRVVRGTFASREAKFTENMFFRTSSIALESCLLFSALT